MTKTEMRLAMEAADFYERNGSMCEVNATLPAMSPAVDHYRKAAETMVAKVFKDAEASWKAVGYGNRATWFHSSIMAAHNVAMDMANTPEMVAAMDKAFQQAVNAYKVK